MTTAPSFDLRNVATEIPAENILPLHAAFLTAHPSAGSTEGEPRFIILAHQGMQAPDSLGFVFRRKSGRWGAAVRPLDGGQRHVMAFDVPRLSVETMDDAIKALVAAYQKGG